MEPKRSFTAGFGLLGTLALIFVWTARSEAYETYTDCAECHGDFLSSPYISLSDGSNWGNDLHDVHRNTMLGGDCDACHQPTGRSPVFLDFSTGTLGLDISCIGCHGRPGEGAAGLRQHHWNAGETICRNCHSDADPSNFTPAGEDVAPPYYADPPTSAHPDVPTDPCNPIAAGFPENYAGTTMGLDNDGDFIYDEADPNCAVAECGNEIVEPGEDCDDGNTDPCDGCSPVCAVVPDSDRDGIDDSCDNCIERENGPLIPDAGGNVQLDTDGDNYGNACDCDFDQNQSCNISDFNLFLPDFAAALDSGVGTDLDGNGSVGIGDFNLFLPGFTAGQPGPSALAP